MFVEHVTFEVCHIVVGQSLAIKRLDFVAHYVAVLLDVVLFVKLVAQCHNVLAGDIGVGIELGTCGRIGCSNIVFDEVPFLAQIHIGVESLNIGMGNLLVYAHEAFLHLTADFTAGDAVINIKIVDDHCDYIIVTILTCLLEGFMNSPA